MLARVEAIPLEVLEAGVPWNWETYPQYMEALGENLGHQRWMPYGPLRHPPLCHGRRLSGARGNRR